jgi:N4-gp56 family major capsid protein
MKFQNFAVKVASAVVFAIQFAIAWVWAALIGTVVGFAHAFNSMGAQAYALNDGASPASMTSGQAPQASAVIHYNKTFTKNLKGRTPAQRVCSRREMPAQAGQKFTDYMYKPLSANTQQVAEGVIGSGISVSVASTTYTLGQWADYVNFSDFVLLTTINPMVENVEREMAYRLGRSIQKLTLAQADFARTVDSSVGALDAAAGTTQMTRNIAVEAAGSLRGRNVQPLDGGRFGVLIHPFFTTDMMVDNSNNSYVDIMKHTPEGQMALKELPAVGEEAQVLSYGGISFFETTELTQTTNYISSGKTAIRTYLVGEDGLIAVRIERPGKTSIGDGRHENLKLWRGKYQQGSAFDPSGMIGGGTSYNVVGTWGLPPDTTMRIRAYDYVPQNT